MRLEKQKLKQKREIRDLKKLEIQKKKKKLVSLDRVKIEIKKKKKMKCGVEGNIQSGLGIVFFFLDK